MAAAVCGDGPRRLAEDPRFKSITARDRNIDAILAILVDEMQKRATADWRARLDAADIPNGEVNAMEDLLSHPYLDESGFFRKGQHPTEGAFMAMAGFPEFSATRASTRRLPPRLGEHTREVLAEAGLSAVEIDEATAGGRNGDGLGRRRLAGDHACQAVGTLE
jgi:crotonobetainyl-CoA:carnitine CoA-transferase CaiB-like acyl-CoA transferase